MLRSPIDIVLERLNRVKDKGKKGYRACCPAHDDAHPSLDVTETADGKVLVKCQSQGCTFDSIASALGLERRDFFPARNGGGSRFTMEDADAALTNRGLRPETVRYFHIVADLKKQAWEFKLGRDAGVKWKYFAPGGEVPKNRVPTGTKHGVYHLKPCVGKDAAWLVEGEPDVWVTHQAGLAAFTFTGGAGNVPKGAVQEVAKAGIGVVHIIYDNDNEGRKGAVKVAAAFATVDIKYTVRRLPDSVGDKGDVTTLYNNLDRDDERFRDALKNLSEVADPVAEWGRIANSADSADSALEIEKQKWPTLVPLQSYNLPVFPVHCLPRPFAQYVRELATTTQTPLALPGSLVLAVLATASQGKYVIGVKPDYQEPLNLWVAVVLDPGNRKSPVFSHVAHPLREYEQRLAETERGKIVQRQTERGILEERLAKAKKQAASVGPPVEREESIQEALDIAEELENTPELHLPRLTVDDITPEKLALVMAQQGGRISLLSAEGNVFSIMAGLYSRGQPNLEIYLKGHSGDSVTVDRLNRPPLHIPKPTLTIGVAIQPTVLQAMAHNREFLGRGLVGRFLFAIPMSPLGSRDRDPPSMADDTRRSYHDRIDELLKEGSTANPSVLPLSPAAKKVYFDFANDVESKLAPSGELGAMTDWGGKVVGAAVRIAGLLHVAAGRAEALVGSEAMSNAVELARYFIEHAKATYGQMGADPALEGAKALVAWLRRDPTRKTFSRRDAHNNNRKHFPKVEDVYPSLELLEEHAHIRSFASERSGGPGRNPSPRYEVHPDVLAQKTHNTQKPPSRGIQANSAVSADCALGPTTGQDDADHGTDDQTVEEQQDPSDSDVLDMVGEFVGRHPEYSQEEIVEYLVGEGVSRPKSVLAAKHVAKGLVTV